MHPNPWQLLINSLRLHVFAYSKLDGAFTSVRGHCCASFRPLNLSWGPGALLELSSGPSTGRAWAVFARGADDRPLAAVRGLLPAGVDAVF